MCQAVGMSVRMSTTPNMSPGVAAITLDHLFVARPRVAQGSARHRGHRHRVGHRVGEVGPEICLVNNAVGNAMHQRASRRLGPQRLGRSIVPWDGRICTQLTGRVIVQVSLNQALLRPLRVEHRRPEGTFVGLRPLEQPRRWRQELPDGLRAHVHHVIHIIGPMASKSSSSIMTRIAIMEQNLINPTPSPSLHGFVDLTPDHARWIDEEVKDPASIGDEGGALYVPANAGSCSHNRRGGTSDLTPNCICTCQLRSSLVDGGAHRSRSLPAAPRRLRPPDQGAAMRFARGIESLLGAFIRIYKSSVNGSSSSSFRNSRGNRSPPGLQC